MNRNLAAKSTVCTKYEFHPSVPTFKWGTSFSVRTFSAGSKDLSWKYSRCAALWKQSKISDPAPVSKQHFVTGETNLLWLQWSIEVQFSAHCLNHFWMSPAKCVGRSMHNVTKLLKTNSKYSKLLLLTWLLIQQNILIHVRCVIIH